MTCTRSKPTETQGEHANSTQKHPDLDPNPGPSCCEVTVLTTAPHSKYGPHEATVSLTFALQYLINHHLVTVNISPKFEEIFFLSF